MSSLCPAPERGRAGRPPGLRWRYGLLLSARRRLGAMLSPSTAHGVRMPCRPDPSQPGVQCGVRDGVRGQACLAWACPRKQAAVASRWRSMWRPHPCLASHMASTWQAHGTWQARPLTSSVRGRRLPVKVKIQTARAWQGAQHALRGCLRLRHRGHARSASTLSARRKQWRRCLLEQHLRGTPSRACRDAPFNGTST